MPLNRLRRKITKETLWLYILALLKKKPMYAYEIPNEIERKFGFKIGKISSYVVLYRLQSSGYVTSKLNDKSGRPRRYYVITKKGEAILNEGISFVSNLLKKLN
ncbi:MAG: PadR family transcriptional regulator [Candidatus Altiarchaeota archaeon]